MDMVRRLSAEDGQRDEFIYVASKWGRGARETEWLPAAAQDLEARHEPTLIITRDTGRKEEREAWQANPIPVLCLYKGWNGWTFKQIAIGLVGRWDSIREYAGRAKPRTFRFIRKQGKISPR